MTTLLVTAVMILLFSKTLGISEFEIYEYVLSSTIGRPTYVPQDIVIISNTTQIKGMFQFLSRKR